MSENRIDFKVRIENNNGYKDESLSEFLVNYSKAGQILSSESLVFEKEHVFYLPSLISKDQEHMRPELADLGFRGRVARHTISVGMTMGIFADILGLDDYSKRFSIESMLMHDLNKIAEIKLRGPLNSVDDAYNLAEDRTSNILRKSGYPEEYVQLSSSVGHNGARDFLTSPHLWSSTRQAAYLADDLLQETVIQEDILAKTNRLKADLKYRELNVLGFPERKNHPTFFDFKNNKLINRFDLQEKATIMMAKNVAEIIGIDWRDLGNYLIKSAVSRGVYTADIVEFNMETV